MNQQIDSKFALMIVFGVATIVLVWFMTAAFNFDFETYTIRYRTAPLKQAPITETIPATATDAALTK